MDTLIEFLVGSTLVGLLFAARPTTAALGVLLIGMWAVGHLTVRGALTLYQQWVREQVERGL